MGVQAGEASFVKNYNAAELPGPLDFLGPLEVFSKSAVEVFAARHQSICWAGVDYLGEDGFMNDCMLKLGVKASWDFTLLTNACNWCPPLDPSECGKCVHTA